MSKTAIAGILLMLGMAVAGCSDKHRIPSGILSREKMQDVLWDMIQADQYSTYITKDSAHIDLKLERLRLYEQVFLLHGVSRDQFKKSYDYYMAHPELTQTLFDSLLSKSNRLRSEAYSHLSAHLPAPALAPDTTHKSPAHPSVLPLFKPSTPNPGHRLPSPGHLSRDSGRASFRPATKRPVP